MRNKGLFVRLAVMFVMAVTSINAYASLAISNVEHFVNGEAPHSGAYEYNTLGSTIGFLLTIEGEVDTVPELEASPFDSENLYFAFYMNNVMKKATLTAVESNMMLFTYTIKQGDFGTVSFSDQRAVVVGAGAVLQSVVSAEKLPTISSQFARSFSVANFLANNPISITIPGGMTIVPSTQTVVEGNTAAPIEISLTPAPTAQTTYNISYLKDGAVTDDIIGPATVVAAAQQGTITLSGVRVLDNGSYTIKVEGGGAAGNCIIIGMNAAPVISAPINETGMDYALFTSAIGQETSYACIATDPAGDKDTVTITWNFGDGTTAVQTGDSVTHAFNRAGVFSGTVTARDEDGGVAVVNLRFEVENGRLLLLRAEKENVRGLKGIGTGTFEILDPATTWNPAGNRFPATPPNAINAVSVRAVPDAGSFRFGWSTGEGVEGVITTTDKQIISTDTPIMVKFLEEDRTVTHFFSKAFYASDTFGDIDADGLGDEWELMWFNPGQSINMDNIAPEMTIAALTPGGDFGGGGNPDGDALPAAPLVDADNLAGGVVKVYKYPIDYSATWTGYAPSPSNPFTNEIEFRGLLEDRDGSGVFVRYADMPIPTYGDPRRGNCPATDPVTPGTIENRVTDISGNDSDGDGMPDGWEYYFWTTIMYEQGTDNWIPFCNNFENYDPEAHQFTITLLDLYTKEELLAAFDPAFAGNGANLDFDNDGLTNYEEYVLGTDPLNWDTDGDGLPDGWEVARGLDPLSRDGIHGADGNPDNDFMLITGVPFRDLPIMANHAFAYQLRSEGLGPWNGAKYSGYDPRVGWMGVEGISAPFTNLNEFMVGYYYLMLRNSDLMVTDAVPAEFGPDNWLDATTDPLSNDTDGDGMPDGWELMVGSNPSNAGMEMQVLFGMPMSDDDWDGDLLANTQEFPSWTTHNLIPEDSSTPVYDNYGNEIGTLNIRKYNAPAERWTNKLLPTNPWDGDTDGDGVMDGLEYEIMGDLVNLNPTSVDTDRDWLPDAWEFAFHTYTTEDSPNNPWDHIYGLYGDPDGDGLPNFQEYLTGAVYAWRPDFMMARNHKDFVEGLITSSELEWKKYGEISSFDFFRPLPSPVYTMGAYQYYKPCYDWLVANPGKTSDDYIMENDLFLETPYIKWYEYALKYDGISTGALSDEFPQAQPFPRSFGRQPFDFDPAFYVNEEFKLPYFFIYGASSTDPRSADSDGDGMDDYWEIFHGINPTWGAYIAGEREPYPPIYYYGTDIPIDCYPYDAVKFPWTIGSPYADVDQDGLNNREESFEPYAQDLYYNSDPTPYWLTDTSYPESHVNLYYQTGAYEYMAPGMFGKTEYPYIWGSTILSEKFDLIATLEAPRYMFDFEINEGYDTDNDNLSDKEEATTTDLRGISDMKDAMDPAARKAAYFDGVNAALRTRAPYFFDKWSLASYTVEMWVRAQEPAKPGVYQTLIERPVMMPIDDLTGNTIKQIRRTFRLQLTPQGTLRAEFQNDALDTFTTETAIENGRIAPDVWYHIAVSMDSVNNKFNVYLNGTLIQTVATNLKPCTGYNPGSQDRTEGEYGVNNDPSTSDVTVNKDKDEGIAAKTTIDVFDYWPAPIVIGASDSNPDGVVCAAYIYDKSDVKAPKAEPEFYDFFQGWIDEVRVWDRVRTQSEIQANVFKAFRKDDILAVNDARRKWELKNWGTANMFSDFPQKLLFHFNANNVPDVLPDATRDANALSNPSDTNPVPYGIDERLGMPEGYKIPWWYNSKHRSTVYNQYFGFVHWIENNVAHLPQMLPLDIRRYMPIYDKDLELLGYRARRSEDWMNHGMSAWGLETEVIDVGDIVEDTSLINSFDFIDKRLINNTANPYGAVYRTGLERRFDVDPDYLDLSIQQYLYHDYEFTPYFSDLLPLNNLVVDVDVPLWDGNGTGYDISNLDSDGDGLPDWYEIMYGLDPYDPTGDNGAYGDLDRDGLDNYSEYLAGTAANSADTDGDGISDYFERDDEKSLTYGELYDDGDGIPSLWERENGLDVDVNDGNEDRDADGWTNFEEYMADTKPLDSASFPVPNVTFDVLYSGDHVAIPQMAFYSYSEKHAGVDMGGANDGAWYQTPAVVNERLIFNHTDDRGVPYAILEHSAIVPGTVRIDFSDTHYLIDVQISANRGYFEEHTNSFVADTSLFIDYQNGRIINEGYYWSTFWNGYMLIDYTYSFSYPTSITPEQDLTFNKHLRSGYNRFCGFFDMNQNLVYDVGEPFGLATRQPILVSWNDFKVEIPITDELFGYPRISWPASTNNVSEYTVIIDRGASEVANIKIRAPRTFLHEGDLINAGIKGLNFGSTTKATFTYNVIDGFDLLASGAFTYDCGTDATRRKMSLKKPAEIINGSIVKFEWMMDYRSEGALIKIVNASGETVFNKVIPLPIRHGNIKDVDYFYSAIPQYENGKEGFFTLPDGKYTYTITEHLNSTSIKKQSVSGSFTMNNSGTGRMTYKLDGTVEYYGKVHNERQAVSGITSDVFDGNIITVEGNIASVVNMSEVVPGTVSFKLIDANGAVLDTCRDSKAEGVLYGDNASDYTGYGRFYYENGNFSITYNKPPKAGSKIVFVYKTMSSPIIIQAYKQYDTAKSNIAVSGELVGKTVQSHKGEFEVNGLTAGKYIIRAFIDSNNNGICDDWESVGYGNVGISIYSPNVYSQLEPISVEGDVKNVKIVIFDKDTDNDLLPDAWEYMHFGDLTSNSGRDYRNGVYVWQEYADGALDSDPNMIDTDFDGLSDAVEINTTKTDTHKWDTDGDGVGDLEEFLAGSDPNDPNSVARYGTLGVEFDENGAPYVLCRYPSFSAGNSIKYILKYKPSLDAEWVNVDELVVAPPMVKGGKIEAGEAKMTPPASAVENWNTGFFKIDVYVDYQEFTIKD